ncbi:MULTISPECIES: two-partner secretion domain-containing protein [Proteus]|uniref:two-partner secretion domain-containing protein n=1 Tax=Proteus TaxID=583 RepID=UPI000D6DFF47|nr:MULTISPECIES: filamentous hemagglutinin N-terminal domain-containing protein [Proteus]NBM50305.1 filamentous hemagglutinin N-terminal domain-containing protein [Proteus sp. G2666]NBM94145.1 filamentous hemagglutinin N-terminal domain-containing protein [Proteus sp. G2662]NBM97590.1 filamentous hemagglutinin N-terminal domain-containing protein [Proteus sp. G2660]NBN24307.1 filamentous hemagglutinin N-terminal domain-containing protein [Proteus sp. G2657]QPT34492.1 filamentous hemagglutinin 
MKLRNTIIIGIIYAPSMCQAAIQPNYEHDKHYAAQIFINKDSSTTIKPNEANLNQAEILIAPKNAKGVSYNKYDEFHVTKDGVILNNNGVAADFIINEVINGTTSLLDGNIGITGKAAHVVIANPNGIACNNCSFSNTLSETLATGKPIIHDDELVGYRIERSISALDYRAFGGKSIKHIGKIVFRNENNRHPDNSFNNINIISNNINLEKGFISSKGDINIYSGERKVMIKKDINILENGMRTRELRYYLPNKIILGDKNGDPRKQGLTSYKNIIINASDTTIDNYGSLESTNSSRKAIQVNLNKTTFNNHGYILAKGGYLTIQNHSFFNNLANGTIGMQYWLGLNKADSKYSSIYIGNVPKNTVFPMNNLTLNISEDSQLVNDGTIKAYRLYTQNKKMNNIQNNRQDINLYTKLLKIK